MSPIFCGIHCIAALAKHGAEPLYKRVRAILIHCAREIVSEPVKRDIT